MAVTGGQTERRYLRTADLRRLRHVFFASRKRVEGLYAGRHATPQRGHSVEFADYREYTPGDAVSDIDWKVYGRSNRLYVKLFEHQADMAVHLLIDGSASMAFRGIDGGTRSPGGSWLQRLTLSETKRQQRQEHDLIQAPSKYDQACLLAASIAFLVTKQQDKVGLAIARNGLGTYHRALGSFLHLDNLLAAMEQTEPDGEASLAAALDGLARRTSRRGLLIVFSDLLEEPGPLLGALAAHQHRGSDVIVFQVLHAEELALPDLSEAVLIDSESGRRLKLNVEDVRHAYSQRLAERQRLWSTALRGRGIDHNVVSTAERYDKALERYLFTRAAMI